MLKHFTLKCDIDIEPVCPTPAVCIHFQWLTHLSKRLVKRRRHQQWLNISLWSVDTDLEPPWFISELCIAFLWPKTCIKLIRMIKEIWRGLKHRSPHFWLPSRAMALSRRYWLKSYAHPAHDHDILNIVLQNASKCFHYICIQANGRTEWAFFLFTPLYSY